MEPPALDAKPSVAGQEPHLSAMEVMGLDAGIPELKPNSCGGRTKAQISTRIQTLLSNAAKNVSVPLASPPQEKTGVE